jgi:hypothetical protein
MPWGRFLRVKSGAWPARLTACRYAIKPLVYSLFEYDDDLVSRVVQTGRGFSLPGVPRSCVLRQIMLRERRRMPDLTTARAILN